MLCGDISKLVKGILWICTLHASVLDLTTRLTQLDSLFSIGTRIRAYISLPRALISSQLSVNTTPIFSVMLMRVEKNITGKECAFLSNFLSVRKHSVCTFQSFCQIIKEWISAAVGHTTQLPRAGRGSFMFAVCYTPGVDSTVWNAQTFHLLKEHLKGILCWHWYRIHLEIECFISLVGGRNDGQRDLVDAPASCRMLTRQTMVHTQVSSVRFSSCWCPTEIISEFPQDPKMRIMWTCLLVCILCLFPGLHFHQ